jgi:hypothetical protein
MVSQEGFWILDFGKAAYDGLCDAGVLEDVLPDIGVLFGKVSACGLEE